MEKAEKSQKKVSSENNTFDTKFTERYGKLNSDQKRAVDTIEGPVLVVAGPGSGKTEILSLRVANILKQTDTAPGSILCLTFTDSASVNMRERLAGLIGKSAYRVQIHTFHSFCTQVIARYPEYFFGSADFHPADDVTRLEILSGLFREMQFSNPLRSEHPDQGYVFLRPALGSISDLKRAGITPPEFAQILEANAQVTSLVGPLLAEYIPERVSKKEIGKFEALHTKLLALKCPKQPLPHIRCLRATLAESLKVSLDSVDSTGSTTSLSEWKKENISKDAEGLPILKELERLPKMLALAELYEKYQKAMYDAGYFDFDDMILEVIRAVEKNELLSSELQESFQYVLVDEFQDTNDAQMRLILGLTSALVHEGRPNIMVVGDDDQAIYKFQGAEVANILSFTERFSRPEIITLGTNYRSTKNILDISEKVISQGTQSLRTLMPQIEKRIVAGNLDLPDGQVHMKTLKTELHEYQYIAGEVERLVKSGVSAQSIAVISRKHSNLELLVPFFYEHNIAVSYEKRHDVLKDTLIREIITLVRFVGTITRGDTDVADEYLPEILSFPFWGIPRALVWELSLEANRQGRNMWMQTMLHFHDERIKKIAEFLLDVGVRSQSLPLERVLDLLIGSRVVAMASTEYEDDPFFEPIEDGSMTSPFRTYYFGSEIFNTKKSEYISFLSSLKVFIGALREYKQGKVISVADCIAFVDTHEKNNMELLDTSPFVSGEQAVTLLTSHKAKGLEFDVVFVISATEDVWSSRGMPDKLSFPKNITARPGADSRDDKLRLLYVALTRAKHTLYITNHERRTNGKVSLPVEFLAPFSEQFEKIAMHSDEESIHPLETHVESLTSKPYIGSEIALLKNITLQYSMSVTHLNNFLDISRGGPQVFLEQNLLRFPQAKTVSSVYGTAMHSTLQYIYAYLRKETVLPTMENISQFFSKSIQAGRLHPVDQTVQIERGVKSLMLYMEKESGNIDPQDKIETDFKYQGVVLGEDELGVLVHITGKIDKMHIDGNCITVTDWKTGKAKMNWEGKQAEEKIQLYNYKRQLLFYYILLKNSKDFGQYSIPSGTLEFLEPVSGVFQKLTLAYDAVEVERLSRLVQVVYKKICTLDFPDITKYSPTVEGCIEFEEDLLEGNI
jgi:DNA helicase II / ATP-dependent DNA helicase PcrA